MTLEQIVQQLNEAQRRNLIERVEVKHYEFYMYYKTGILIYLHHTEQTQQQLEQLRAYFQKLQFNVTHLYPDVLFVMTHERLNI